MSSTQIVTILGGLFFSVLGTWLVATNYTQRNMKKRIEQPTGLADMKALCSDQLAYKELKEKIDEINSWKHDLHNHYQVLFGYLTTKNWFEMRNYLLELHEEMKALPHLVCTGSPTLDSLLSVMKGKAHQIDAIFSAEVTWPESLTLTPLETTSLLGNILENALEACANTDPFRRRYVHLTIKPIENYLFIRCENSADPSPSGKSPLKKAGQHGIGLRNIESIAKKYGGTTIHQRQEGVFISETVIPLEDGSPHAASAALARHG